MAAVQNHPSAKSSIILTIPLNVQDRMKRSIIRIASSPYLFTAARTRQFAQIRTGVDATSTPHQWAGQRSLISNKADVSSAESRDVLSPTKETSESKLFKMGTSLASRMSTDRTIHCTEVDSKGNIVVDHKEIKRSDLVSKASQDIFVEAERDSLQRMRCSVWHSIT